MDRARPVPRWCHAAAVLQDFAMVTWAVDPERLAAMLPAGFVPDRRDGCALVSAVAFRDDGFHFRAAPWARLSCGQVDYRACVRQGGETGVWFFGSSLDSSLVGVPRAAWQMPWHRDRVRIDAAPAGVANGSMASRRSWRLQADGGWGRATIDLEGAGRPFEPPPGYDGPADVSESLVDPSIGWYGRRDGSGVGRYSVWHEPLRLEQAIVDAARCQVFVDLGLIDDGQPPICAGLQHQVRFDVHTPPEHLAYPDVVQPEVA